MREEANFYYVVETSPVARDRVVSVYKINVGVRHAGLNNAVRSLMAFARYEMNRKREEKPLSQFSVHTESQYTMKQEGPIPTWEIPIDLRVILCTTVHDLYSRIGYNNVKKKYEAYTMPNT